MLKKIAVGIGIGYSVFANAAVVNSMDFTVFEAPASPATQSIVKLVIQPRTFVSADGFKLKIDLAEFVRSLDFETIQVRSLELCEKIEMALAQLANQEANFDKLGTLVLAGEPSAACPDRPVIPDWAWAWELSSPEGW